MQHLNHLLKKYKSEHTGKEYLNRILKKYKSEYKKKINAKGSE